MFVVGFSPRRGALTIYGTYDDATADPLLGQLGAHSTGKGCLYVKRLDEVDARMLESLVRAAWSR